MPNILNKLKKLGDRGLVIAEARAGGDPEYYFVLEEEWTPRQVTNVPEALAKLVAAGAAVGQIPGSKGAFIDFGKLHVKPAGSEESDDGDGPNIEDLDPIPVNAGPDDIVIHENDTLYAISRRNWAGNRLPPGAEGDAGTLVDRGAIAANIPNDDIPIGTYCVLVNLALLNEER